MSARPCEYVDKDQGACSPSGHAEVVVWMIDSEGLPMRRSDQHVFLCAYHVAFCEEQWLNQIMNSIDIEIEIEKIMEDVGFGEAGHEQD